MTVRVPERPVLAPHARRRRDPARGTDRLVGPESIADLSETAAAIVDLMDGRAISEIVAALERRYGAEGLASDVLEFVAELARSGWLREADGAPLPSENPPLAAPARSPEPRAEPLRQGPLALLAELTYACPLRCPYCSNPLDFARSRRELSTDEWRRVVREAADLGAVHVHFSGGEPLVRRDLEAIVREARDAGLYSNLSTGATLADDDRLAALRDAGLDALQISVLDSDPASNDALAGARSFEKKRLAALAAKRLGFPLTLNIVLHRRNLDRIESIVDLAFDWEADRVEFAHAQYVGWAFRNREALMATREQLDRALEAVARAAPRAEGRMEILHVLPDYHQTLPKACMGGWGRLNLAVAPDGLALPCPTAGEIPGLEFPSVRDRSIESIWFDSEVFRRFRGTDWMPEPCKSCDRRDVDHGGCRCQAFLVTGNVAATDPVCSRSPDRGAIDAALARAAGVGDRVPLVYRDASSGRSARNSSTE